MPFVKVYKWPVFVWGGIGSRSCSARRECFYCHVAEGHPHESDCVCVLKLVEYVVSAHGKVVGTFQTYDPCSWTPHNCEFHKNESSWCTDNALDAIDWTDDSMDREIDALEEEQCTCGLLEFRLARVIDEGPFVDDEDGKSALDEGTAKWTHKGVR